jgi:hypothetical protein
MTRRTLLSLWVAAPVCPHLAAQSTYQLQLAQANDLLAFKKAWDHWTSQLLKGINDLKAGSSVVKEWGRVRQWLP